MAGRLPGSAMAMQGPSAAPVLSTRTIAAARAAEPSAPVGPPQTETHPPEPAPQPESVARELLVPPDPSASTAELQRPRTVETPAPVAQLPGGPSESRSLIGDRGPQLLDDIDASLPPSAGGRGGSVTVRLTISEQGTIERMQILRSSPPGLLDEAALSALAKVHFSPGLRGGLPVRSDVVYEIDFAAIGKGNDVSGRTY